MGNQSDSSVNASKFQTETLAGNRPPSNPSPCPTLIRELPPSDHAKPQYFRASVRSEAQPKLARGLGWSKVTGQTHPLSC
jgi:hypothetical protein